MKTLNVVILLSGLLSLNACGDGGGGANSYASTDECQATAKKIEAERTKLNDEIGYEFWTTTMNDYGQGLMKAENSLNIDLAEFMPKPISSQIKMLSEHQEVIDDYRHKCGNDLSAEEDKKVELESQLISEVITQLEEKFENVSIAKLEDDLPAFKAGPYSYVVDLDAEIPEQPEKEDSEHRIALVGMYLILAHVFENDPQAAKDPQWSQIAKRAEQVLLAIHQQLKNTQ